MTGQYNFVQTLPCLNFGPALVLPTISWDLNVCSTPFSCLIFRLLRSSTCRLGSRGHGNLSIVLQRPFLPFCLLLLIALRLRGLARRVYMWQWSYCPWKNRVILIGRGRLCHLHLMQYYSQDDTNSLFILHHSLLYQTSIFIYKATITEEYVTKFLSRTQIFEIQNQYLSILITSN
jgi:hypothetical protein